MTRFVRVVAVALLLFAACSAESQDGDGDDIANQVTHEQLHQIREDEIRGCMLREGFDYERRTYVPVEDRPGEAAGFLLPANEGVGYGGSLSAFLLAFGSLGAPRGLSQDEIPAYDRALLGATGAVEGEPVEGCFAVGREAVAELRVIGGRLGDEETLAEERQRIAATAEFAQFERAWTECMLEAGSELGTELPAAVPAATGMDAFASSATNQASTDARSRLRALLDGDEPGWTYTREDLVPQVADAAWIERVAATDRQLTAILQRELTTAKLDADCRNKNRFLLDPVLDA